MINIEQQVNDALASIDRGDFPTAEQACSSILSSDPNNFKAHYLLGYALHADKQYDRACQELKIALQLDPNNAEVLNTLGCALRKNGDLEDAQQQFERAISLSNTHGNAWTNLGLTQIDRGDNENAVKALLNALQLQPQNPLIYFNLGNAYRNLHLAETAIEYYSTALAFDPSHIPSLINQGNMERELGKLEAAEHSYKKALALNPGAIDAHINLASTLEAQLKYDESISHYETALALKEKNPGSWKQLPSIQVFGSQKEMDESLLHYNIALTHLVNGRYLKGWAGYQLRMHRRNIPVEDVSHISLDELAGTSILLHKEQGIGDELFFLRFLAPLKQKAAKITYLCSESLYPVIRNSGIVDEIVTECADMSAFDHVISICDLPFITEHNEEVGELPAVSLSPDTEHVNSLATQLDKLPLSRPFVGLTWRAGLDVDVLSEPVLRKRVPLDELCNALEGCKGTFFVLQRDPTGEEMQYLNARFPQRVVDLSHLNNELTDMLAALSLLDDYIGVSNTNMHLRAALAKPAHVLISSPPEWRWQPSGKHTPWFTHFSAYRQNPDGNWNEALTQLGTDLTNE